MAWRIILSGQNSVYHTIWPADSVVSLYSLQCGAHVKLIHTPKGVQGLL